MSADIYDALAPHYRAYADARSAYIEAVDAFVHAHAPAGSRSLLDVGAGDGVRGMALARRLGIDRTVLCDASAEMAVRCAALGATEVWTCRGEDMPVDGEPFDLVICLWNVLGHVTPPSARVEALTRMRRLLAPQGRLFLDVNNRHNAAAYGALRVIGRVMLDAVLPDERRGDTSFEWEVAGRRLPARGHLFTLREVESLARLAGLSMVRRVAIDYRSGAVSPWFFRGQLVFEMRTAANTTALNGER